LTGWSQGHESTQLLENKRYRSFEKVGERLSNLPWRTTSLALPKSRFGGVLLDALTEIKQDTETAPSSAPHGETAFMLCTLTEKGIDRAKVRGSNVRDRLAVPGACSISV
jgi:hypothetical protein